VDLSAYTTLGLGGPARRFAEPATGDELIAEVRAADQQGDPLLVLGGGSNLVVSDDGFDGTALRVATSGLTVRDQVGDTLVTAAAGESWEDLTARCAETELAGIECLAGIPGLVGATPIQNVGAYGQEVAETITTVRAFDRARAEVVELAGEQCGFGYRTSMFKRSTGWQPPAAPPRARQEAPTGRFVVLEVTFALTRDPLSGPVRYAELARSLGVATGDRVPLAEVRAAVLALRRGKGMVVDPDDPDTRSAGSFFTNPVISQDQFAELERIAAARFGRDVSVPRFPAGDGVKVPAAWLIERAGFTKNFPYGAAIHVSAKHTLALVNHGGGSTKDLIALAGEIRDGVKEAFGIKLAPEPVLVGVTL
jgi:UDP-N-acetylmuramate dehydrogenase